MNVITDQLKLGIEGKSTLKYLYAKQGDKNSRFIRVTLDAGSGTITLGTGATAKIRALLPDGTTVAESATINNDDTISVELSENILRTKGLVKADIAVFGSSGSVLSSEVFCIRVQEALIQ